MTNALHRFAELLPWWGWLAVAWGSLLTAWCYPHWCLWLASREHDHEWQAREDMEAALWAECDAAAARRLPAPKPIQRFTS